MADSLNNSTIELYVGLGVALLSIVFPLNVAVRGAAWLLLAAIAVHLCLRSSYMLRQRSWIRWAASVVFSLTILGTGWTLVKKQYREEHRFDVTQEEEERFISALQKESFLRGKVEIRCPYADENACVYGAKFIHPFRKAGWTVIGNGVRRGTYSIPKAGIVVARHGVGKIDESNPDSGLWVQQKAMLRAVQSAFKSIGKDTQQQAEIEIPEDLTVVYFGVGADAR